MLITQGTLRAGATSLLISLLGKDGMDCDRVIPSMLTTTSSETDMVLFAYSRAFLRRVRRREHLKEKRDETW